MGAQWVVPAEIIRVVDGDTVELDLDLGWHIRYTARCRIVGINAPEMNTDEGRRAKTYAETLLPAGATVVFYSHSLDKYGRPLGEITFGPTSTHFGAAMLDAGHAVIYQ